MTAAATVAPFVDLPIDLPGELVDALIEAVSLPLHPCARSAVICAVVLEMCSAVEWLQDGEIGLGRATDEELNSIRWVASSAEDHRRRMTSLSSNEAGNEVR